VGPAQAVAVPPARIAQAEGELLAFEVSVYGVVAPLLKVIGEVGQGVVDLAAQQILAVVQLRKIHVSSVADFLSA